MSAPDPAGGTSTRNTFYSYDNAGNVTSATDAMGYVSSMTYDLLERKTSATAPSPDGTSAGRETTWAYFTGTGRR